VLPQPLYDMHLLFVNWFNDALSNSKIQWDSLFLCFSALKQPVQTHSTNPFSDDFSRLSYGQLAEQTNSLSSKLNTLFLEKYLYMFSV